MKLSKNKLSMLNNHAFQELQRLEIMENQRLIDERLLVESMKYVNCGNTLIMMLFALFLFGCKPASTVQESGKQVTLLLEPQEGNPRNSEGDFIQLTDGRILFIYTHFTDGTGDHASAYLAARYSNDGGVNWTQKDELILSNEGGMNIMSVSLLRLTTGEIALFYLRKNSERDCVPFMRTSADEAKTWSAPIRCMDADGYFVVNNDRFVQLPSGRIIFPTALHNTDQPSLNPVGKIMCYYSDDNGNSWNQSQLVENPENVVLQEPGVVLLNDNRLMMFCRTNAGAQYFSFSTDKGETWSPVEIGNIKSPLSPASIERIPATGDLLLVWNNNFKVGKDGGKRTPLTMAISKDEGNTWIKTKSIETDPAGWYCYTAIDFLDDYVLLGHCAGNTKVGSGLATTQITRLSLEWIYSEATSDPFVKSEIDGKIELACDDQNAKIFYALNGKLPTGKDGILYQNPIVVSRTTNLLMHAFDPEKTPSQVVSSQVGIDIFQKPLELSFDLEQGLSYNYYQGEFRRTADINKSPVIESGVTAELLLENSLRNYDFAFAFSGYIEIPVDGRYTFYLESNDGSIMYLNNQKLIDNDGPHGTNEEMASISLRAGMHEIVVIYFQQGGGSSLNLMWAGPGFTKDRLPSNYLFHKPVV